MGKVYYWIKKGKSFYEYIGIKKLFVKAQASVYQTLYIYELMLLQSATTDGYLYFEGYEECFADEIALILEQDVNAVRMAIMLMFECKLIEKISEDMFFLPQFPELIGKETDAASRMRKRREKLEDKRNNVTLPCNIVQNCYTEIDIEKEKDKELHSEIDIDCDEIYRGECENVILLDWQWKKLKKMFPDNYRDRVDRLSRYIARTGKNYPSHYATIVHWAEEDAQKDAQAAKAAREQESRGSFDTDSFFGAALERSYAGIKEE